MAKNRSRKKDTEIKVSDNVKIKDVPVVDDVIIEDKETVAPADGFMEEKAEEKVEEKVKMTKETKVEDSKPEDGLIVEEAKDKKNRNNKKKKPKVIKKVHNHGGRISV